MSVIDADIEMAEPVEPLSPYWKQVIEDAWACSNTLQLQRDRLERFATAYAKMRKVFLDDSLPEDEWETRYEETARNCEAALQALVDAGDIEIEDVWCDAS